MFGRRHDTLPVVAPPRRSPPLAVVAPAAAEMFVTGTMGEITPVAAVDAHRFAAVPGPVTARIIARFRQVSRDPAEGAVPPEP